VIIDSTAERTAQASSVFAVFEFVKLDAHAHAYHPELAVLIVQLGNTSKERELAKAILF
jgi:hypothetical protein